MDASIFHKLNLGASFFPQSEWNSGQSSGLSKKPIQKVVAENLNRLMDTTPALDTVAKVAAASRLGAGTVHRVRKGDGACAIDTLEAIAGAFGLAPWQLLIPALDPANPPALRQMTEEERAFYSRLQALFGTLPK